MDANAKDRFSVTALRAMPFDGLSSRERLKVGRYIVQRAIRHVQSFPTPDRAPGLAFLMVHLADKLSLERN